MGDYYTNILPIDVKSGDAEKVAASLINLLVSRKIVEPELTDCVLSASGGYAAGENCISILIEEDGWSSPLSYKTNGVEVIRERNAYESGALGDIKCPQCNESVIEREWAGTIDSWATDNTNDEIICPSCGHSASIDECDFELAEDFSEVGLVFWNWGDGFKESFIKELENLTSSRIVISLGKL